VCGDYGEAGGDRGGEDNVGMIWMLLALLV
jgi:hypothetical protein